MRIHEALHGIVEKFAPMTDMSATELQTESSKEYYSIKKELEQINDAKAANADIQIGIDNPNLPDSEKTLLLNKLQDVPKITIKHKIVEISEKWWVRYIIGILFIWAQKKIQDGLNPAPVEYDFDDEDRRR